MGNHYIENMKRVTGLLVCAWLASGCAGTLCVKKVEPGSPPPRGLRYHLPQPYVIVYGDENGEAKVETIVLPDVNNEYAIQNMAVMSVSKLAISLDRGMLKDIQYSSDTTQVATKLVETLLGKSDSNSSLLADILKAKEKKAPGGSVGGSGASGEGAVARTKCTWGPRWYRVVDTGDNVWLEPVEFHVGDCPGTFQPKFSSIDLPPPPAKPAGGGGGTQGPPSIPQGGGGRGTTEKAIPLLLPESLGSSEGGGSGAETPLASLLPALEGQTSGEKGKDLH